MVVSFKGEFKNVEQMKGKFSMNRYILIPFIVFSQHIVSSPFQSSVAFHLFCFVQFDTICTVLKK